MSSISFNIVYNSITKKISINKANTIQQLVNESFTQFKVDGHKYQGKLIVSNSNKTLDNSLPIRLSSLLNNSKLLLKVEPLKSSSASTLSQGIDVNVKLIITNGKSLIHKLSNQVTLHELLVQFNEKHKGDIETKVDDSSDSQFKNVQLSILNLNYHFAQFSSIKLESIIGGNVNSVVIRLNYIHDEDEQKRRKLHQEQQEIIQLQLKQQSERNQKLKQQRELEAEQERARIENEEDKSYQVVNKEELVEPMEVDHIPGSVAADDSHDRPQSQSGGKVIDKHINEGEYVYKQPEIKETSQLYVPDTKKSTKDTPNYENPEEDYEMTVNQAMTYQKIIQNSGVRKPAKVAKKRPGKYLIRIKFPDGNLLQINYLSNIDEIKFGQLLKRIDEALTRDYINHYNLKLSYPPFLKIDINFSNNNLKLIDMKEFQSEQISLIWEVSGGASTNGGPYIDQSKINEIKQSSELPEVLLESHRKELPSDSTSAAHGKSNDHSSGSNNNNGKSSEKKDGSASKTPKWLKFK